ncbi:MAG: two-component sensor histidine kinase, partial [Streptococcaceae bacterium]|nr:two-component sensor histidine kinase [Streptococcaceae bacterium]
MKKFLKLTWKSLLTISLFYAILSIFVIVMVDRNAVQIDMNRVLGRAQQMAREMVANPNLTLDSSAKKLSANANTEATGIIAKGSAYASELSADNITITIPIIENGKTTSYLAVTDTRSSVSFTNISIIMLSMILWMFSLYGVVRRALNQAQYTKNTVAKIRNIERSPLTQSYLITKNDDPITTALNHLGDNIQLRILSNQETKENLYEFIEFFQFPIFVYDGKGAFH